MEMNIRLVWGDCPPEVLRLIARKLADIRDYICFSAVCVSWRLAASPTDLGPQLPWLVVPTLKEGCDFNQDGITTISFFNLPGCRRCFYPLEIPETQGKWIYASAHGWLLMIGSRSPQSTSSVSLLNPITGATIPLPLLPTKGHKDSNITPLIHPCQPEFKLFLSLFLVEVAGDVLLVARYLLVFKLAVFKRGIELGGYR